MRLSEFKDEKGIEVVAKLLVPISKIAQNQNNAKAKAKAKEGGTLLDFASAMLQNNPKEVMAMLAILDDKDPNEYHCSAATVVADAFNLISDPALLKLFGLQSETAPESGSVSENIEALGA